MKKIKNINRFYSLEMISVLSNHVYIQGKFQLIGLIMNMHNKKQDTEINGEIIASNLILPLCLIFSPDCSRIIKVGLFGFDVKFNCDHPCISLRIFIDNGSESLDVLKADYMMSGIEYYIHKLSYNSGAWDSELLLAAKAFSSKCVEMHSSKEKKKREANIDKPSFEKKNRFEALFDGNN